MKNNISIKRKEYKLTQQDLATILNTTRQTIISLEKGHYNPSIILAYKIAKTFNSTIEEIFDIESEIDQ